ncbi:hypothetical protein RB614_37760 [Phytohabitans sp. ZYX-F-186]|uniref:Uncharacterized protein n=1 Tax=Phytohabitans maris TaxID=3071409 RepID=A0ABU0ZTA0_9ACTN|nr:hypothetical protein [Phytohabitans sp. ZYX-F-186]MDQ7910256.1 hypothetical protein [Phytohabitans sp. ZYX-F-186]
MGIWYTTREAVKAALDYKETARSDAQVDAAIESASRAVEGLTHRRFYPWTGTRYFDWPDRRYSTPWRLWLDNNEVASISTLVAGGLTIAPSDYFLRRSDGLDEPPYTSIEIDLDSSAAFTSGPTFQRAVAVTGVFIGCPVDEVPAGALAEALDATETAVDVTDAAAVGVGHILRVGDERMIVTGRQMLTTGQTLQSALADRINDVTVVVTNGAAFSVGEVILLDGERMWIVDIAGNNLIVKRQWDGSVLASHTGSTIYASRTVTVERGALGTTAATHDTAAAIVRHKPPALVTEMADAEAINTLLQKRAGYARTVGSGDNEREAGGRGLRQVREDVRTTYGRKARTAAV